jgi:hypothetical protein
MPSKWKSRRWVKISDGFLPHTWRPPEGHLEDAPELLIRGYESADLSPRFDDPIPLPGGR